MTPGRRISAPAATVNVERAFSRGVISMSATNYCENKILDAIGANTTFTTPTNVYLKLHTADPGEDATTAPAGETTRQEATFDAAAAGSMALTATVSWTNVSTTETVTHWSLWDNVSAGNPLVTGTINGGTGVSLTATDNFDITALTITCD
jgi:hypothetical protein